MGALWVTGDTLEVTRQLPDASVDLIITSPPFLALRSYLPADDPAKVHEIGQESTPGAFLDVLLDLVVEWRRILTPHGSLCVELGDTYAGSGGGGGDYLPGGLREGQQVFGGSAVAQRATDGGAIAQRDVMRESNAAHWRQKNANRDAWPLDKSLCLIPQLFAVAMSYGVNPLTGRTIEPWRVRNVIRWCRPNPPVGALGDKFRPATSEMLVACTGRSRWFDLDAVRTPVQHPTATATSTTKAPEGQRFDHYDPAESNGAPPLDFWVIPTHPYKGSHYATFPPALVVRPVEAMCPRQVCQVCGEPSTRITSEPEYVQTRTGGAPAVLDRRDGKPIGGGVNSPATAGMGDNGVTRTVETLGWSDCGHNAWRPGRVMDPFGGSGTTLEVATGHGRDGIGIDLDKRNADLARERIGGLFFTELTATQLTDQLTNTRTPGATCA